jgi:hypothetical protein
MGAVILRDPLIVSGNPAATMARIAGAPLAYRAAIVIDTLVLFCDIGVAVLLYAMLRPVGSTMALLAVAFRLVFVAVMAAGTLGYLVPLIVLTGALPSFDPAQSRELAMLALKLQGGGYTLALVFFGVHCLLVGGLILRSPLFARGIGILMVAAGTCYLVNSANNLLPATLSLPLFPYVLLPGLVGEAALTAWLLFGVSARWHRQHPT